MAEDKPAESGGLKMGDLKKLIVDTIQEVVKPEKDSQNDDAKDTPTGGGSIANKVREEIEKLRAQEKKDAEKETLDKTIAELTEKTKEKPPVERRRVHKWMGWGENAD